MSLPLPEPAEFEPDPYSDPCNQRFRNGWPGCRSYCRLWPEWPSWDGIRGDFCARRICPDQQPCRSRRSRLEATLTDGRKFEAALVGDDPATDLAVLRLSETGLPHAEFGRSATLRVGQMVIAIGNPLGYQATVTAGYCQRFGSQLTQFIGKADRLRHPNRRAAEPGNSGGPLVDGGGRVVGINTAIIGGAQGICFAIGIDTAIDVVTHLMREGRVRRSKLGVLGQTVPMDRRLAARLKRNTPSAVLISDVHNDGPGHSAGLIKGDILLALDGEDISSVDDLHRFLTAERANKPVSAQVLRRASIEAITIIPSLES